MTAERLDVNGYYEEKGLKRHMVIIKPETQARLKTIAKEHGIMQGEVVDALIANVEMDSMKPFFDHIRMAKRSERTATPKAVIKDKLKEATPEQLAEIQRILAGR